MQMLRGAAVGFCLSPREAMPCSKDFRLGKPHGLVAGAAEATLTNENRTTRRECRVRGTKVKFGSPMALDTERASMDRPFGVALALSSESARTNAAPSKNRVTHKSRPLAPPPTLPLRQAAFSTSAAPDDPSRFPTRSAMQASWKSPPLSAAWRGFQVASERNQACGHIRSQAPPRIAPILKLMAIPVYRMRVGNCSA